MSVRAAPSGRLSERWLVSASSRVRAVAAPPAARGDLFERTSWLYAFLRESVFRDDTDRIDKALWSDSGPQTGSLLL